MKAKVLVPDGAAGPWSVETFEIQEPQASAFNSMTDPWLHVAPGTYKRLRHSERGVVMSNTPMEVETHVPILVAATGDVLVFGLGLGMVLQALVDLPHVRTITVVEKDLNVLRLVAPTFQAERESGRVTIIRDDAFTFEPQEGARYNAVWHDIWDNISDANVGPMNQLEARYASVSDWQGFWARDKCLWMKHQLDSLIGIGYAVAKHRGDEARFLELVASIQGGPPC